MRAETQTKLRSARQWSLSLLGLSLALVLGPTRSADRLNAFSAHYAVARGGVTLGEASLRLTAAEPDRYVYEFANWTTGWVALVASDRRTERSTLVMKDNQIRPLEYSYQHTGGKKDRNVKLVFDWERQRVTNVIGADSWTMAVPEHAQDKLGYMIALMRDLAHGKTTFEYPIADGGKLKVYRFKVAGHEQLETALGVQQTVRVQRLHAAGKKRQTILWLAPRLDYAPVRIEHHKGDTVVSLAINAYRKPAQ